MTYQEIEKLIRENNHSKHFSDEFVACLIWKETNFNPAARNSTTSATGLMLLTKGAVETVNNNTPKGIHFNHSEMTDAIKNTQSRTHY